jgi:adenine-specific DNA-methyltransferase
MTDRDNTRRLAHVGDDEAFIERLKHAVPVPYVQKVQIGDATLYQGDCLAVLPTLGKVDAVITDPPYGKIKGDFDKAWTNRANMLPDVERWIDAIVPVMMPNATLWWFAWPSLAGRIEDRIARRLNVLSHIVWTKPAPRGNQCRKEVLRSPMPVTERILMAEHYGADNMALGESGYVAKCDELRGFVFEPLRAYLANEWKRADLTHKDANKATGTQASGHWFTQSQWVLPTQERYEQLRARANSNGGEYLRREYEDLRREYEDLRREYEDLRRYFDCRSGDQFSDVWQFGVPTQRHGHPTEKPVDLMAYIVRLSVRNGGTVIDPFMGSGTTGVAALQLGRKFIGIERGPKYFDIACKRIEQAQAQGKLFAPKPQKQLQEALL